MCILKELETWYLWQASKICTLVPLCFECSHSTCINHHTFWQSSFHMLNQDHVLIQAMHGTQEMRNINLWILATSWSSSHGNIQTVSKVGWLPNAYLNKRHSAYMICIPIDILYIYICITYLFIYLQFYLCIMQYLCVSFIYMACILVTSQSINYNYMRGSQTNIRSAFRPAFPLFDRRSDSRMSRENWQTATWQCGSQYPCWNTRPKRMALSENIGYPKKIRVNHNFLHYIQ